MNILSILLILASVVFVVMGCLHIHSIVSYNRRLKRQRARAKSQLGRRKQSKQLDLMTLFLFVTALLCLMLALLVMKNQPAPTTPTESVDDSDATTQVTQGQDQEPAVSKGDGWLEENGVYYYLLADGTKATGWQDIDGSRYYFQKDGKMTVGWKELDNHTYYFRPNGTMAVGKVVIDGVNRFFGSNGQEIPLVNPWNPVPEGQEPDLVSLSSDYGSEGCQVDRSCLNDLISMLEACNRSTSKAYVVSAYRSYDHQQRTYQRKVNEYLSKGYSQEDAEKEAATVVALPGTSEHQLGLAVDIIDTQLWDLVEEQENLPAQKWLMEHSWEYGFLFRYPKDKTDVTGIIYEPWHYRYVGRELAKEIHDAGLTLEEYMARLG